MEVIDCNRGNNLPAVSNFRAKIIHQQLTENAQEDWAGLGSKKVAGVNEAVKSDKKHLHIFSGMSVSKDMNVQIRGLPCQIGPAIGRVDNLKSQESQCEREVKKK